MTTDRSPQGISRRRFHAQTLTEGLSRSACLAPLVEIMRRDGSLARATDADSLVLPKKDVELLLRLALPHVKVRRAAGRSQRTELHQSFIDFLATVPKEQRRSLRDLIALPGNRPFGKNIRQKTRAQMLFEFNTQEWIDEVIGPD